MRSDPVESHGGFHPNPSEEMKYFRENRVYSVQIESTLSCPQGCLYCYASAKDAPTKELPRKDIHSVLDSAHRMGVRAVDWLGGDPLVRRDWYSLMRYAMERGLRNNIWTSGMPLEDIKVARKVLEVSAGGFVSVHLDTLDERTYKLIHTGDPGRKIKAILTGVENLQSLGKDPNEMINCITFTKIVAKDVQRTIEFFFKEKGMRTCLTQMCRAGLAKDRCDWVPDLKAVKTACEARDKINYPGSRFSMGPMDTNKFYCGGMICVTIDGDVTPCSVIRKGYGNIHDTPLEKIVKEHKDDLLFLRLRNPKNQPGPCRTCKNNPVCWGCRAAAFYEHSDILGLDPNCYISQL